MSTEENNFVHLHLHTEYSLLDGAVRIPALMDRVVELGMPAVAMTDHGNLFGAIEFYVEAHKRGINPIFGCEMYLAPGSRSNKAPVAGRRSSSHLTLLAESNAGWQNLVKLVSVAHLESGGQEPRIDKELLAAHGEGLICLSGCLVGEINEFILSGRMDDARKSVEFFLEVFGRDRFFLEIHDHGLEAQATCTKALLELAREYDLQLVAANDVHFIHREDHEAHDVMVCIGTGSHLDDEKRLRYSTEVYLKSPAEMREIFREWPEACENTLRIAERCRVVLDLNEASIEKYPRFPAPGGEDVEVYFRRLCEDGLVERYGPERLAKDTSLWERMDYEIGVMAKMGFLSYFLIVWDFIKWAKDNGIPVGPGRGSAAGSIVAYVLGITDLDPIQFGLIFERFLNPDRVSPPDVDVDFCQERRGEVIEYVRKKYGETSVSHIITFGTMGAKSVIRDVGRVMGWSYGDADRISRMIPTELGITLNGDKKKGKPGAIDKNPELKEAVTSDPAVGQLWEYATYLEGITRNSGIHAAGIVIADFPLDDVVPLTRGNDGEVVTQLAMGPLTKMGLLKMDFLGLKTLTVIEDAVRMVRKRVPDLDISRIPLDDLATYELCQRGDTVAVFQLESGGMANTCRQLGPDCIEDIVALLALYRPGPMDFIPDYINRKKGKETVEYVHPLMEEISRETYGILVYQEQVQKAANVLAGYSLGQADLLRRAMGKKKPEEMAKQRVSFVEGCAKTNGIGESQANKIFDVLEKFAQYGFNKSHSAAYGIVSYRTAWLKANHPVEFMAAVLSNEINNTDKIGFFIGECRRMGIELLPPDVNRSELGFTPEEKDGKRFIRYGLEAIKNVGGGVLREVVKERNANGPYTSLEDFARRVDAKSVNKKVMESLVKCGAFDFTEEGRHLLYDRIDSVLASASAEQRDKRSGQGNLFDMFEIGGNASPSIKESAAAHIKPWTEDERLGYEKELTGFYLSGHPLNAYRAGVEHKSNVPVILLTDANSTRKRCRCAGFVSGLEVKYTKKDNKAFAVFQLEDFTGTVEAIAWSDSYSKVAGKLVNGKVIAMKARVDTDQRSEAKRLTVDDVEFLEPDTEEQKRTHVSPPPAVRPVRKAPKKVEPDAPEASDPDEPMAVEPEFLPPMDEDVYDVEWEDQGLTSEPPAGNRKAAGPVISSRATKAEGLVLLFQLGIDGAEDLNRVNTFLQSRPGSVPVSLLFRGHGRELLVPDVAFVEASRDLLETLDSRILHEWIGR